MRCQSLSPTHIRTALSVALPRRRGGGYWIHTSRPCLHPARSRARLLPALRPLSSPRPPSPCRHPGPRSGTLTRATAAAGGERAQPLKLPPGPRLGPGSPAFAGAGKSGATVGGVRCEVTEPRCVHAVGGRPAQSIEQIEQNPADSRHKACVRALGERLPQNDNDAEACGRWDGRHWPRIAGMTNARIPP